MIFNYLLIYLGIKVTFGWYRGLLGVNATQAWNCHSCSEGVGEGIELYHAGPRLRCLVFNHWIAALCVLWVQYDSSIILVSTSCETCSHPSSVGCVGCVDAGSHIAHTPDITSMHLIGSECQVCIFVHANGFRTRRPKQDSLSYSYFVSSPCGSPIY